MEENLGCPGGRNVALARLREYGDVDVVVELDDDGLLVDADVLRRVRDLYAADPRLGIVGFRIADEHGETQQRHVPRVGKSDPLRGGYVTGFLGGGHAFRMAMLAETGDWPARFFFAHEETDLAWRAADAGWKILYAPELLLQHPKTSPARHAIYYLSLIHIVYKRQADPRAPRGVDAAHPRPHPLLGGPEGMVRGVHGGAAGAVR